MVPPVHRRPVDRGSRSGALRGPPDGGGRHPRQERGRSSLPASVGTRPVASGAATAATLLSSAYPWESDHGTLPLRAAVQRFRDVNGYVGLPIPAKPAFLKVFRRLINGSRPPEQIYLVHDASHVLTG